MAATLTRPRAELNFTKKIRDFASRRVDGIGTMHDVLIDAGGQIRAYRSFGGFLWVGGAHDVAILRDGTVAFEHLHHHWAGSHEADQVLEKWQLAMHRVKALGFG